MASFIGSANTRHGYPNLTRTQWEISLLRSGVNRGLPRWGGVDRVKGLQIDHVPRTETDNLTTQNKTAKHR